MNQDVEKLQDLTPEQKAQIPIWVEKGIEIGFKTGNGIMDEAKVRELTDAHRVLQGIPKATNFIVMDSPYQVCATYPDCTPDNALYGNHDINWLNYYDFCRQVLKLPGLDDMQYLLELCHHVNWMWMSSDTTIVTHLPVEIHYYQKQEDGYMGRVLHNENGMAVKYKDGWGMFFLHGNVIPRGFQGKKPGENV